MKHKGKIFELLRNFAETPQELAAVEEMIVKVEQKMLPVETVSDTKKIFNGFKFYKNKKGRYSCTITLHRFLWQFYNGEIPEGYDIHHKDFNKENNDISNLELVTKEDHKKIHLSHKIKRTPRKKQKFICTVCGNEYESVNHGNNNYCSQKCKKIAERVRAVKIKICKVCGKIFSDVVSKHRKHCSLECAAALRKREIRNCIHCGKEFSALTRSC